MKYCTILLVTFFLSETVLCMDYDVKNLPKDLNNATDIVIAKKVAGAISYANLTNEIDSFQKEGIDWRNSPARKRLQERNKESSTFLIMNSIKGSFKVGEEIKFRDYWIPKELNSVNLYFLQIKNNDIESNYCLTIPISPHKKAIVELANNKERLINFVLKTKLSPCEYKEVL